MLTRTIRDCRDYLGWWSCIGLGYSVGSIWQNQAEYIALLLGVVLLMVLATFWHLFRRLRYEQEWLTRFNQKGKEKG